MKLARLVWTGLAVVAVGGTAAFAIACSDHKAGRTTSAVNASASGCSAEMAAACTPEMAAACAAKGAKATTADMAGCPASSAKGTMAITAGHAGCATKGAQATTASAAHAGCESKGATQASAAMASSACGTSAKGATAVTASASAAGCCASGAKGVKASSATTAAASSGRVDAMPAGASCGTHGKSSSAMAHGDCDACDDMSACQSDIAEAGGRMQVVPLKNGLMYVYTAESSGKVRAVQAAVMRHAERMQAVSAAADKATLCPSCKELRGAAASGKLNREVVNIESGCLTLVTSSDARLVTKLYALAGVSGGGARAAKS